MQLIVATMRTNRHLQAEAQELNQKKKEEVKDCPTTGEEGDRSNTQKIQHNRLSS